MSFLIGYSKNRSNIVALGRFSFVISGSCFYLFQLPLVSKIEKPFFVFLQKKKTIFSLTNQITEN